MIRVGFQLNSYEEVSFNEITHTQCTYKDGNTWLAVLGGQQSGQQKDLEHLSSRKVTFHTIMAVRSALHLKTLLASR